MSPPSRRRTLKGLAAFAIGFPLAGCGGGDDGDENTVDMTDDLVFEPDYVAVDVGTTVTWRNAGSVGHSVTTYEDRIPDDAAYFASGGFESEDAAREAYTPGDEDSGDVPGDESFEHTFETVGTYEYFCIPHESTMTGTIEVEDA